MCVDAQADAHRDGPVPVDAHFPDVAPFPDATPFDARPHDATSGDALLVEASVDAGFDATPDASLPDTGTIDAGPFLFDSIPSPSGASSRGTGGDSCGTQIDVATTTTITRISVKNALSTAGNVKFLIFDGGGTLVYQSAPKAFPLMGD